ncbi:MAG: 2-C-methyl-D-erythritol 4-phosphate cytidylyltransferase [Oscillospiraceae bacterium]|nr:2-C-methyl-D-erythritol 4-phosphate cytidylyltransferase [Oscillospiraceae bacterium]
MNIAVLLAGGTGQRFGASVPKQFVTLNDKPMIVYALEIYERSPHIDAVEVVCVPEYIPLVRQWADRWGITKLKWIVEGGSSCQESTYKGILGLERHCSQDDLIMLGMSTSIFVDEDIISDSLRVCKKFGNAFAAMQCIYNLAYTDDGESFEKINRKEKHRTINMPWTAPYGTWDTLYRKAAQENIEMKADSYAPTLFLAMGETLYFSKDTPKNKIHVTTQQDYDILCALFEYEKRSKDKCDI